MCQFKLGHAHLKVRDLDQAVAFYTRFLGLWVVERQGNQYAFLSAGDMHHEIALQNVGPRAPQPPPHGTGLYHVAFEVPDRASFAAAYRALVDAGVEVAPVDHLISWAIYFNDPDGNGLEIYWDTRCETGGQQLWRGRNVPLPESKILATCAAPASPATLAESEIKETT
jgi:catechol 2,3-dioxygenase